MDRVDFVIPLKKTGIITRAVLEGIRFNYNPRRIIIVTNKNEIELLQSLSKTWNIGSLEYMDEYFFFYENMGLTLDDISSYYDNGKIGNTRECGWWIQQLIKLGASTQIPGLSDVYFVWDADLIPIKQWPLLQKKEGDKDRFHIAILQEFSKSEFNVTEYAGSMHYLTGLSEKNPEYEGTFVTHHMCFHKKYVGELLNLILKTTQSDLPWPKIIMNTSNIFFRFSEYKTYSTFMMTNYPDDFFYYPFSMYGKKGIRFREPDAVIEDMKMRMEVDHFGFTYEQVYHYFTTIYPGTPTYVQFEHLYGFADLP